MKIHTLSIFHIILFFFTVLAPLSADEVPSLQRLIRQLGSDSFAEREKAMRRLLEFETVPADLRLATKSPDLEVRRRAVAIIRGIETRHAMEGLAEARRFARDGQVDEAIERVVRWSESDPEGTSLQWLSHLAEKLIEVEDQRFGKAQIGTLIEKDMIPSFKADRFEMLASRKRIICPSRLDSQSGKSFFRGRLAPRGNGVEVTGERIGAFIVSTSEVRISDCDILGCSVIFSTGDVDLELRKEGVGLLIISDGNVSIRARGLCKSLVLAHGDVSLPRDIYRLTVFAGGKVKRQPHPSLLNEVFIRENDRDGLGPIKFFDPKKAGIEVTAAGKGVRVKNLMKDKSFATVLRTGDVVTAIEDKETPSAEMFRKVLRAALAEERRNLTFTIRRSGEPRKVLIPIKH